MFFCPFLSLGSSWTALTIGAQAEIAAISMAVCYEHPVSLSSSDLSSAQLPWQCHHHLSGRQIQGTNLGGQGGCGADLGPGVPLLHNSGLVGVRLGWYGGGVVSDDPVFWSTKEGCTIASSSTKAHMHPSYTTAAQQSCAHLPELQGFGVNCHIFVLHAYLSHKVLNSALIFCC